MAKKSKLERAASEASGLKGAKKKGKTAKSQTAKKTPSSKKGAQDISAVARKVRAKAVDLASNPLFAEIVAASLVATAAAIKDPKKARALAEAAGDELGKAAKGAQAGAAMWQLALDVAKRSISSLSTEESKVGAKEKAKTKR